MDVMFGVLVLWFALTFLSLCFVVYDQFFNTPSMRVMTWAWVLVILYTGPLGLFIYFMSCRQPIVGTHDEFIKSHWKQSVGSLIHCVAGDATAIIMMAIVLHFFDVSNGVELIAEYVFAYLFGLLIFQALFMRSMFPSYWSAMTSTIFAETVSMNMVMIGMFFIMLVFAHYYPISKNPFNLYFWGRMSLATMVSFIVAYPINSWMVKRGIKHGMMSKPSGNTGHQHKHHHGQSNKMTMGDISLSKKLWVVVWTYGLLTVVLYLTSLFVPIVF